MDLEQKGEFNRLWHLYSEASRGNCFIYNKQSKLWYTPEEFRAKYDKEGLRQSTITGLLEELVIRDPIAGINAAQKQMLDKVDKLKGEIAEELAKLTEFAKMTIQYQQSKLKK